jgi:hypothetical protein
MVIALSIVPLAIMLQSFSPFGLNQAQGQIYFPCPNGYQTNSVVGLCEPIVILNPNLLECPDGYIENSSGDCELVRSSSQMLNNTTNQTRNQGSSLIQQPAQNQTLSQLYPLPVQQ